jgi:hypothetical protein
MFIKENGQVCNMITGEIVSEKQATKELNKEIHDKYIEVASNAAQIGAKVDYYIAKDKRGKQYSSEKVKEEYEFVKVFTVSKREIKKSNNLSKIAKAAYFDLESEISFPTNTIIIDGDTPSIEQLCEFLDLKKSKLYEVLKELENAELIKRKKINGQLVIYINPFLYNRGYVDIHTIEIFKNSKFNPDNNKK